VTYSRKAGLIPALAGICMAATAADATDAASTGPQASAAQLIAAHGETTGPALHIVYDSASGPETGKLTVDITSDFVSVHKTASKDALANTVLYDFRLKRVISLDEAHHTFSNDSTYMMVDFRYTESFNRKMLRGMLGKLGVSKQLPQSQNPYWDQQSLSFLAPNDDQPAVEPRATQHGGIEYIVDGKTAAYFEPSTETLSADEKKGFARFLWNNRSLHPIVIDAILATGKIPSEIEALNFMGNRATTDILKLSSVERNSSHYPLTTDYQSDLPQKSVSEPLRGLLPTMLQAVAGRYGSGPRSIENYRAALADAWAKGETFPYYVLDNEFALQYGMGALMCLSHRVGAGDCSNIPADLVAKYRSDDRTVAMIKTFDMEQQGDIKGAIAQRRAISRDGVSDPYMFDLWIGDALTEGGDEESALSLLPNAIKGNPYVGAFYKDLGDAFERSFLPVETWLCYDLARALPAGDKAPIVEEIAKKEQFLETKYPQFF
jgi:hypothetical protein